MVTKEQVEEIANKLREMKCADHGASAAVFVKDVYDIGIKSSCCKPFHDSLLREMADEFAALAKEAR